MALAASIGCGVAMPREMARAQPVPSALPVPAGAAPVEGGVQLDLIGPDGRAVKSGDAEGGGARRDFNAAGRGVNPAELSGGAIGAVGKLEDGALPGVSISGSLTDPAAGRWNPSYFKAENPGELAYKYNLKETKPGVAVAVPVTGSALLGMFILGGLAYLASHREKQRGQQRSRSRRR